MIESLFGGSNNIVNILGAAGFIVVVLVTAWVLFVYVRAIKNTKSEGELAEDNWDGIGEYKNPLPFGWAVILVGMIVWTIWYWLLGYPTNAYSQIGEWNQENQEYMSKFEQKWQNVDKDTMLQMGQSIFLSKCAVCHSLDAQGMNGKAANLVEYGTKAHIEYVVKHGSKGLGYDGGEMMPFGGFDELNDADVSAVASYVASKFKNQDQRGKDVYGANCASCHGEDGKGIEGIYPDLTAYGTLEYTKNTIKHGKKGNIGDMPSFSKEGTLSDVHYNAVAEYILSLQGDE